MLPLKPFFDLQDELHSTRIEANTSKQVTICVSILSKHPGHTGVTGTLEEEVEVPPLGGAALQQRATPLLARPRRGGGARATERKEQAAAIACGSPLSLSLS